VALIRDADFQLQPNWPVTLSTGFPELSRSASLSRATLAVQSPSSDKARWITGDAIRVDARSKL
jgi:hypothetical protein